MHAISTYILIFHIHAYILINTLIGLTSSLNILLKTAPQAKLSECSPVPAQETGADIDTQAPISDQSSHKSTATRHVQIKSSATSRPYSQPILLPDSSQVKDDCVHTSDVTEHSEAKSKRSLTNSSPKQYIAHDINVQAKSSSDMHDHDQMLTFPDSFHQQHSTEYQTFATLSGQNAPIVTAISNEPLKQMFRYNDKLVTALSLDPQGISRTLLSKGLIPEHIEAKMQQNFTSSEKATILVTTLRQVIKISPKQFCIFLDILSEKIWMKDIVDELRSCIDQEHSRKDTAVSDDDNGSAGNERNSESDVSSEGESYIFPKLNSEDKAELEAQLILSADSMRKKFASLLVNVINSFQHQCIDPRRLASTILALTEYDDPVIGKPLLEREKEALMKAQSVDHTFDVLRPHMTFFNYEILEFLIEEMGSPNDKLKLQQFLHEFRRFCRRSVFEVPPNVLGHSIEKMVDQQKFCVKITRQFKAALLVHCTIQSKPDLQRASSTPLSSSGERICAPELGISLEDAKHIQRKFASVLKLKVSSIYLDSVSSGSTILIFLLPSHVTLAGLSCNPDIISLSYNGIHILCGPPGKPEPKELTSNGLIVHWSQPEYGCDSLARYVLYYWKKCSETKPQNEWQKLELGSLETRTCVPELSNGGTYIFKICTVSDVGTLQYSDESDPIIISADGILTSNIYKVVIANKDALTSAFSLADPNAIAAILSIKGIISNNDKAQIIVASNPREKVTLLITAIEHQIQNNPEKFPNFLSVLSEAKLSLPGYVAETLWSDYYDSVYKQYLSYLKFLYTSLGKEQTSPNQWPPSVTKKFFRLAMIQTAKVRRENVDDQFVQMTITGKVDDILRQKYPIQLQDIFKETEHQRMDNILQQVYHRNIDETIRQRKVILLEGAPGCGKSTLSVYICQQWEKGQLFNQFKLVILIRLRDPAVKNSKGLADLLPCPDTTTAQQIAARMLANKCQDVLFILDGWDELPRKLRQNSFFHQLVQSTLPVSNSVCESTVIVTSRPTSSGDLYPYVSSRVEILGFTAEELYLFFTECLKGDTEAVKILLERIKENPEVAGSCYLPLNATILVHLFKSDHNTLPTTLCGIFSNLVLNCIKRHLKLRTQHEDALVESLDLLPEFVKKPFLFLCQLAYDGVMEDKIIFTSLPTYVNTLSLLQGVESFIGRAKAVSYNFIHLSIQELLAARHIATHLLAREQVSKFNELFNKSRFNAVFRFYAAITKLKTPGIKKVVINATKRYFTSPTENRILMVSLMHCLYEAQDSSLCVSVAQQLRYRLDLKLITLTPSDCLCLGYFLAHMDKMAAGDSEVNLDSCSIGDQGCMYLVSGLRKCFATHSAVTTLLNISMSRNAISPQGLHHLSTLLMIGCINYLNLSYNTNLFRTQAVCDMFAEQLKNNATLRTLLMQDCGLNSLSAKNLAEALTTNKHLEKLYIGDNELCDDGIRYLADALRVNQGLKELWLASCGMTDVGLQYLAKSLQYNSVLATLQLYNLNRNRNRLTEKIVPVLTECLQNNHILTQLDLPKNLESYTTSIEKAVNDVRKRFGLLLIKVEGMSIPLNV